MSAQITTATRFWDASGVSFGFSGGGLELNVGSLASILEGGVVFDTLVSGGRQIGSGHVFDIFDDRDEALAATFEAPSQAAVRFAALFPSAVSGLTEGAPVRYQGVRVGVVTSITGFVPPDDRNGTVQLLAVMALQPSRMGLEQMDSDLEGIDYVDSLVAQGLRAQLVSTSILGGSLAIDLLDLPDAPFDRLQIGIADNPLIPSVESEDSSLTATAEGVLTRINDLPIEELLASATDLLDNLNRIAGDEDTRALPAAALATIEESEGLVRDVRSIVTSPDTAGVLLDVQRIADDIAALTAEIRERELASALADTLEDAQSAAANIAAGTENLDTLSAQAEVLFDDAGRLLSSEADAGPAAGGARCAGGRDAPADLAGSGRCAGRYGPHHRRDPDPDRPHWHPGHRRAGGGRASQYRRHRPQRSRRHRRSGGPAPRAGRDRKRGPEHPDLGGHAGPCRHHPRPGRRRPRAAECPRNRRFAG